MADWLGKSIDKIKDTDDADTNFVISPRMSAGGISSWSFDMSVVEDFAWGIRKPTKKGNYGVVLIAQVDDNPGIFLDFNHIVNSTDGFQKSSAWEQEVLALGSVKVSQISWVRLQD